jgi:type III pantothenate kinase
MIPDVVVDVGNTRIKWRRCSADAVTEMASLSPEEAAWEEQASRWALPRPAAWAVAGAHPARQVTFAHWAEARGDRVVILDDPALLPLTVRVPEPRKVGIDRLLDAVAANSRRRPRTGAAVVDAGSAITVDWVDDEGAFRGGAILPGAWLMAKALHDYTALLPLVEEPLALAEVPENSTIPAMRAGITAAVVGGIRHLLAEYRDREEREPQVFFTGGDAPLLCGCFPGAVLWPEMTLEGLRLSARALP